jgi:Transglutaminase-like superfamily
MEAWRRFRALSGTSRSLVVEAAASLAATRVGLRLAGFRRWKALLMRLTPATVDGGNASNLDQAQYVSRLTQATARNLFFTANCLERSLTLWWLLRRRGIAADVRIGVRKAEGQFEAHAWVDCGSVVLNDEGEMHAHFAPFERPVTSMETQTP